MSKHKPNPAKKPPKVEPILSTIITCSEDLYGVIDAWGVSVEKINYKIGFLLIATLHKDPDLINL